VEEPLTGEQVAEFFRQGFLVLESPRLDGSELAWCRETLLRMLNEGAGKREGRNLDLIAREGAVGEATLPTVLQPSLYEPALRQLAIRKMGLDIAKQLLGATADFCGDHTIYKPSRRGAVTPWHQDEAFREPGFEYEEISIWIAMTESTIENGAMAYIPGSHKLGLLPHRLQGGATSANTIECYKGFDAELAAVRPIPAGTMIIHHARTVHGSGANGSSSARLGYILQYSTPVRIAKTIRPAPWLKDLRNDVLKERRTSLWLGGIFPELLRVLRSDRHSMAFFWRRRLNTLRKLYRRKP
jgi:hypothetical protein